MSGRYQKGRLIFVKRVLADLRMAFCFLTRLPVSWPKDKNRKDSERPLADAVWAFPVVGLKLAIIIAGLLYLLSSIGLPPVLLALFAVFGMILLTGALHEDGVADVADGFGGGAGRDGKLKIMRDSYVGSYGVLALIFTVGLKTSFLAILFLGSFSLGVAAMVSAAVLARGTVPLLMAFMPLARSDGLASSAQKAGLFPSLVALFLALATALFLLPFGLDFLATLVALLMTLAVGRLAQKQINGYTGDVLGASVVAAELAVLLTITGYLIRGASS